MSDLARLLNDIHERLLGGSVTASLELYQAALDPLQRFLMRKFHGLSKEEAYDHAVDAIAIHIDELDAFDPVRSSLWTFLCLVAKRNVQDAWRARSEHVELEKNGMLDLELWSVQSKNDHTDAEIRHDAGMIMREYGEKLASTETEKEVLKLMLEGERELAPFAKALGLRPDEAGAELEVKRAKDRIKFRMKQVSDDFK